MDCYVREKLQEWGLSSLQQIFEDEEVDEVAFQNLNEDNIQKLIPKTGPQVKFISRWKKEFVKVIESVIVNDLENSQSQCVVYDDSFDPSAIILEDVSNPVDDNNSLTSRHEELDFSLIDKAELTIELSNPITDLITTLKTSALGLSVLCYYKCHRNLTEEYRNDLVDSIISVEIRTTHDLTILPARFIQLADLIVDTFPTEIRETYYIAYRYDKANKLKILPKGKLIYKYNNLYRARLIASGAVTKKKTGTKRKRDEIVGAVHLAFSKDLISDISEEEFEKKIDWLKSHIDPWSKVKKLWIDTSKRRIHNLITDSSITNYIESFVLLKHLTHGPELIDIDFSTIYSNKKSNLFDKFDLFEKQLIAYCNKKKRKSESLQLLLKKISDLSLSELLTSAELKKVYALKLLPLVLPPPGVFQCVRGTGPPWRPSKEEVQQNFILQLEDEASLIAELRSRRENLKKYGLTEQPIVAVVGKDKIESCSVHINNIKYQLPSVLEAIDTAFKSFYAFQLQYPKESGYPWMVIQRKLYEVTGEKDGPALPCILTLITDLNNTKI